MEIVSAQGDKKSGNMHKLFQGQFCLNKRKKYLHDGTIKNWIRLTKEMESPSLEILKTQLDRGPG